MKRALLFAVLFLAGCPLFAQNNGALMPALPPEFRGLTGLPASGAKLCTLAAGSTTNWKATYSDAALTLPLPNPITLNALGRPTTSGNAETAVYLNQANGSTYKVILYAPGTGTNCNGTQVGAAIWTRDNVYDFGELMLSRNNSWTGVNTFVAGGIVVIGSSSTTAVFPSVNFREFCPVGSPVDTGYTAATALLPSTGGVVDCSNLQGAQSSTSDAWTGQTKPVLFIPPTGTWSSSVSITFPATTTVEFLEGGILSMAVSTTATVNGEVRGTISQHFTGSGNVVFGSQAGTPQVYPQWWNVVGDDSTDNSAAFTKMITSLDTAGLHIQVPPGIYRLGTGQVFPNTGGAADSAQKLSITLDCAGPTLSVFKWTGAANGSTMFSIARNGQNAQPINYHRCGFTNAAGSLSGNTNLGVDMSGSIGGIIEGSRFVDFGEAVILGMGSAGAYHNLVYNNHFDTTTAATNTTIAIEVGKGVTSLVTCTGAPGAQLNTTGNHVFVNYFHAVTEAVKVTCGALNVFEHNAVDWVTSPAVTGFEIIGDANDFIDNYVEVSGNRYICTSGNGNKIYGLNHPGGQGTNNLAGCGGNTLIFDPHVGNILTSPLNLFNLTGSGGLSVQTVAATSGIFTAAGPGSTPITFTYNGGTKIGKEYIDANGAGYCGTTSTAFCMYLNESINQIQLNSNSGQNDLIIDSNGKTYARAGLAVVGGSSSLPTGYTFYVNSGTSGINGRLVAGNLTVEAGTKSALCIDPATKEVETNAAADCTVSSLQYKDWVSDLTCQEAERIIAETRPAIFKDKDGADSQRFGFAAEWAALTDPRMVYYRDGKPHSVDYPRFVAVLTREEQCRGARQQAEIDDLNRQLKKR